VNVTFATIKNFDFYKADIIIAHRLSLDCSDHIDKVLNFCRSRAIKFVYDIDDDFLELGPDHVEFEKLHALKPLVLRMLRSADQIWVSTEILAARYHCQFPGKVITIPNTLDDRIWSSPVARTQEGANTDFLYMGTPTHRPDFMSIIFPAFSRLEREFKNTVNLTLIGVVDEIGLRVPYHIIKVPSAMTQSYPAFVSWLQSIGPFDIGLAPLLDTYFNRAKSNMKQLEYAALGLPTIAADLPPYRAPGFVGRGVVLAEPTADGFYNAMREMVYDGARRHQLRHEARRLASELLGSDDNPRVQIIRDLLGKA